MKKWIVALALILAVAGLGLTWNLLPGGDAGSLEATTVQPTDEYASLTLNFSEAYFTGTWCYISCADGTGDTVRTFSTNGCCSACASSCGTFCTASGAGPAVLCEEGF